MRVSEATAFGGPEVLALAERPWPVAGAGEVVVRIEAANVNPTDLGARSGAAARRLPELAPPFVLGWDLAGVVEAVGPPGEPSAPGGAGGPALAPGDPVVGMIPWYHVGGRVGAYAEAAAVEAAWLAPRPAGLDAVTGATVPLNALTASQMLALLGLQPGSTLLVVGASGAVGSFAVQLAAAAGVRVIAQAADGDEPWVASLGAAELIARDASLAALAPLDAVFDAVPIGPAAAAPVRDGGAAVFTRRIEGTEPLAARGIAVQMPLVATDPAALAGLTAAVAAGRLRTRVARTLDLADAAEAHRLVERGGLRGKVVLRTAR
jgi:NADPH:quinone reductase-like Zn-dependent oxidoreductase